jgi:hypothetical protein
MRAVEFSAQEACLIMEATRSTSFVDLHAREEGPDAMYHIGPPVLYLSVVEGDDEEDLAHKWGVNMGALLRKLRGADQAQMRAICHRLDRIRGHLVFEPLGEEAFDRYHAMTLGEIMVEVGLLTKEERLRAAPELTTVLQGPWI